MFGSFFEILIIDCSFFDWKEFRDYFRVPVIYIFNNHIVVILHKLFVSSEIEIIYNQVVCRYFEKVLEDFIVCVGNQFPQQLPKLAGAVCWEPVSFLVLSYIDVYYKVV